MNPTLAMTLLKFETRKVFRRTSARVGLAVMAMLGTLTPIGLYFLYTIGAAKLVQALDPAAPIPTSADIPVDIALKLVLELRSFFLLPAFLILVASLCVAAEYSSRTLREDLLRPIPRWGLLWSKWGALVVWSAVAVLLCWAPNVLVSAVLFGGEGSLGDITLGYFVAFLADAALAAWLIACGVILRSVALAVLLPFLFLVLERGAYIAVLFANGVGMVPMEYRETVDQIVIWFPSSLLRTWSGFHADVAWSWQGFTGLTLITLLSMALATALFERMDVP